MNLFENLQKMQEYTNDNSERQMKNFNFKCRKCGKEFVDKYDYPLPTDCGAAVRCPDCNDTATITNSKPVEEAINDEMSITVDVLYPMYPEDEAELLDFNKNYNLKFDRHANPFIPSGGEMIITGNPFEIKRYFEDQNWDDWFVDWEDNEDAKQKFMDITGEDENGWEAFLYESKIISKIIKDEKDVEVITEGVSQETVVFEGPIKINESNYDVWITDDDPYYNVYVNNDIALYLQEPKEKIKDLKSLAIDACVDLYKDKNNLEHND